MYLRSTLAFFAVALYSFFVPALAQDGALDATFGTGGKVWNGTSSYPISTTNPGTVPRILVQPDGKILHIAPTGSVGLKITRFLPNGDLDTGFGSGGSITLSEAATVEQPRNAYMLPDGKFIVIGESRVNPVGAEGGFAVIRFNADGTLDNTFDGDGKAVAPLASSVPVAHGVTVQSDGKIVVAGTSPGMYTIVRFTANGTLDASFDGDGIVRTTIGASNEIAYGVTIDLDGKIVVAGQALNPVTVNGSTQYRLDLAVLRLMPDGSPDNSFGSGGGVTYLTPHALDVARNVMVSPSTGKITVTGDWSLYNDIDYSGFFAARFLADGRVDSTFGNAGYADHTIVGRARAVDGVMQMDEKIIIGGYNNCGSLCPTEGRVDIHLMRLTTTGALDPSFSGGKVVVEYQFHPPGGGTVGSVDMGGSIASQGLKLITGGLSRYTGQTRPFLARLLNSIELLPRNPAAIPRAYVPVPSKIEAEGYTAMQGVQREATADAGGGQNVGYIDAGDWMEYRISVPGSGGAYEFRARVASQMSGGSFEVRLQSGAVLATVAVPNTGSWQAWTTVAVPINLPGGNHTIRLVSTSGAGWNINWLEIAAPSPGQYVTLPALLQAEAYTAQQGTQTEPTSAPGGGLNVGYIDQGDWLEYRVSSPGGSFLFHVEVASAMSGGSFELRTSTGELLTTMTVPNSGGWQNWTSITNYITVPAGNHTIRITSTSAASWNINWLEFRQGQNPPPGYVTIPARIEAEAYITMNGVQTEATSDAGGGQNVGYIDPGDWIEYNIAVPAGGGTFGFDARVASATGGSFELRLADGTYLQTISVPNTGGWQNWTTVRSSLALPGGHHTIRLVSLNPGYWNINWLEFFVNSAPGYVAIPSTIQAEDYTAMNGVQTEATSDAGGGQNVGYIDAGDWLEYKVQVGTSGTYRIDFRTATPFSDAGFNLMIRNDGTGDAIFIHVPLTNTGGYQSWNTQSIQWPAGAGNYTIRLTSAGNYWNINYLTFTPVAAGRMVEPALTGSFTEQKAGLQVYPNPVQDMVTLELSRIEEGTVSIEVISIDGRVVKSASWKKGSGAGRTMLSMSDLRSGQYLLRLRQGNWVETRKVIKR